MPFIVVYGLWKGLHCNVVQSPSFFPIKNSPRKLDLSISAVKEVSVIRKLGLASNWLKDWDVFVLIGYNSLHKRPDGLCQKELEEKYLLIVLHNARCCNWWPKLCQHIWIYPCRLQKKSSAQHFISILNYRIRLLTLLISFVRSRSFKFVSKVIN